MASETNSARLCVRPTRDSDLGPLTTALEPEVPAAQVARRLEESRLGYRDMLVAELDEQVVGMVSLGGHGFQRHGSLRLFALDVGAAFRRRGVATALVRAVEAIASGRALDKVNLEVAIDNKDAIRLYERLGVSTTRDPGGGPLGESARRRNQSTGGRAVVGDGEEAGTGLVAGRPARPLRRRNDLMTAKAGQSRQSEPGSRILLLEATTLRAHRPQARWRPESTRGYNGCARRSGKCRNR